MRELNSQERKTICFNILSDIDGICKRHNITYFMAYGTLIGTIRHQGFIPWDNDIDIWVKWKDYKRLYDIIAEETDYEVINLDTNDKCAIPFTKISDRSTVIEWNDSTRGNYKRGVAVDIFPLCPFENSNSFKFKYKLLYVLNRAFIIWRRQENAAKLDPRGKVIRIACRVLSGIGLGQLFWRRKYEKMFKNSSREFVFQPFSTHRLRDVHRAECFGTTVEKEFEGKLFECPAGYDEVLRDIYGDYMKLPPEEERISNDKTTAYLVGECANLRRH